MDEQNKINGDITPLFSTTCSFGDGGIFTLDKAGEKEKNGHIHGPVSICDLAKQNDLKRIYLVESKPSGFMQAVKNFAAINCVPHFGYKVIICEDINDKSEASFKTESKVVIWPARDTAKVYEKLIKVITKAATDGFYYQPRLDWKTLKGMWDEDFMLSLPFYSSFLAKNSLTFATISPDLPCKPLVMREIGQDLPIDMVINRAVDKYIEQSKADVDNVKTIYYKMREDAKKFLVYRCILGRKTWDKPNMEFMCSKEFSWESYCELTGKEIK